MSVKGLRPKDNATICLARFKVSAPQTFEELLTNFRRMRDDASTDCVQATLDRVQVMQGKAQQLADLVKMLEGCMEETRVLEAKMKEQK